MAQLAFAQALGEQRGFAADVGNDRSASAGGVQAVGRVAGDGERRGRRCQRGGGKAETGCMGENACQAPA